MSWCRPGESLGLGTGNSTDRYQLPLPPTPTIPTLASPTPLAGQEAQNLLNDLLWQCRAILPCSCPHSFQAGLFCLQYAPTWPCRIPNGQSDQREFLWPCGRATTPFFCSGYNGRVHRGSKRQPHSASQHTASEELTRYRTHVKPLAAKFNLSFTAFGEVITDPSAPSSSSAALPNPWGLNWNPPDPFLQELRCIQYSSRHDQERV